MYDVLLHPDTQVCLQRTRVCRLDNSSTPPSTPSTLSTPSRTPHPHNAMPQFPASAAAIAIRFSQLLPSPLSPPAIGTPHPAGLTRPVPPVPVSMHHTHRTHSDRAQKCRRAVTVEKDRRMQVSTTAKIAIVRISSSQLRVRAAKSLNC
ncbi:hypothetical protein N431DRAFT_132300 [Stipitochalara longipes BDJ]|nr:hypothetical protein N431DRAFT_132300 [Stipitochalara longipes BDJ]